MKLGAIIGAGAGALTLAGLGVYALKLRASPKTLLGTSLILYTDQGTGAGEFSTAAELAAAQLGGTPTLVRNGQDILNAVRSSSNLSRVVFAGHGSATSFLSPGRAGVRIGSDALPRWISVETLARELAPRLRNRGVVITFAGCRSGADPSEANWSTASQRPGGARGLAGALRDAIVRFHDDITDGEIRAKSTTGGSLGNAMGRIFPLTSQFVGRPGVPLMDAVWGPGTSTSSIANLWDDIASGEPVVSWSLGGPLPSVRRPS